MDDGSNGARDGRALLMGLPIDRVTEAEAIGAILDALDEGRGGWVITPNLDHLRQFRRREDLRALVDEADLVVADGMPLVWASRLQGTPLPDRIAGSELIWSLSAEVALSHRSVYLLGDVPKARELAERKFVETYPGLRLAGSYSPPLGFDLEAGEVERIRRRLVEAKPDVVYVALGFPKQDLLIAQLRSALPSAWFVGVGISLSFLGGHVTRAPHWMTRAGLEWAHRLGQEPRRLARRYLVHGLPFAARLLAHALAMRVTARARTAPARRPAPSERRVVFVRGAIERERAELLSRLDDPAPPR